HALVREVRRVHVGLRLADEVVGQGQADQRQFVLARQRGQGDVDVALDSAVDDQRAVGDRVLKRDPALVHVGGAVGGGQHDRVAVDAAVRVGPVDDVLETV